jgi:hypothetical protein
MVATRIKDEVLYEFDDRPEAGETMPVAPGMVWLRMPLPFALGHINLWLLEDEDGWTIVDSGVFTEITRNVWHKTFAGAMQDRPARRIIATHLHPDHAGCAGWLAEHFGVELWMSREEYLLCRILVADTGRPAPDAGTRFYKAAGFPPEAMSHYQKMFGMFGKYVARLPESYHRLKDGDSVRITECADLRRPASADHLVERERLSDGTGGESAGGLDRLVVGVEGTGSARCAGASLARQAVSRSARTPAKPPRRTP